jgi:5-methylcytosine-specific restriction endonuclease McrA
MEFSWRTSFYRRQWKQGNLQLLCQTCNAKKDKNQPF